MDSDHLLHDTDISTLIRAFTARTSYSQEQIAREANLSLKTVQNVANRRSSSPASERAIRNAIVKLYELEPVGGLDAIIRLERVEEKVDTLAELLERITTTLRMTEVAEHPEPDRTGETRP